MFETPSAERTYELFMHLVRLLSRRLRCRLCLAFGLFD